MGRRLWFAGAIAALVCGALTGPLGAPAGAARGADIYTAAATITGPVTTGNIIEPVTAVPSDLAQYGYVEQEFFASGTAHSFTSTAAPANGRWSIAPSNAASYETRIIVRRPASPAKFNGTVVVEWMNVSVDESAPDWDYLNPMLMRDGYAYVAVSAQAIGVQGGRAILGTSASSGLVHQEPSRYGSLHHPGDQYALDMFAQIGRAMRSTRSPAVFGPLDPRHVVAVGESQSAFYLTTFADAIQPRTDAFDGIFIHSRGGGGAGIGTSLGVSGGLRIRTDLKVPVFMFETQTDLTTLGYAAAQQPNTARIRTWEVAGTSHADSYLIGGDSAKVLGCTQIVNDGPQHLVVQAAFTAFEKWVVHGTAPPTPSRFRLASRNPVTYDLDKYGNVNGGVRTPAVDVPIATLSGALPAGSSTLCSLFGSTTPFSAATLASLYPTKADYIADYTKSLNRSIRAGFILPADRAALLAQARAEPIPG